jgi:hypothetical protein
MHVVGIIGAVVFAFVSVTLYVLLRDVPPLGAAKSGTDQAAEPDVALAGE